jgi:hypothetical protein
MRRFLIWSALAVVIGLAIAGGGYWAYWNFYARFQPVTVARNQAEIQRLLDEASWVSEGGGGQPLYIIGYRDSAASQRYEREEAGKLRAAGVEVRVVVFARPDKEGQALSTAPERATVAELWLSRDWSLYQRWTATPVRNWTAAGIPAADGNLARGAVVEAGRDFVARLTADLKEAGLHEKVSISKDILNHVIESYTGGEAGVRELKRCIQTIISKLNLLRFYNNPKQVPFAIKDFALPFTLKKEHVELFLKRKETVNESIAHLYM